MSSYDKNKKNNHAFDWAKLEQCLRRGDAIAAHSICGKNAQAFANHVNIHLTTSQVGQLLGYEGGALTYRQQLARELVERYAGGPAAVKNLMQQASAAMVDLSHGPLEAELAHAAARA